MNMPRPAHQPHQTTATSENSYYRPPTTRQPNYDYSSNSNSYQGNRRPSGSYDEGQRKVDSSFSSTNYRPSSTYDEGQRKVDTDYSSSQNFNNGHRRVDTSFSSTNHRPTSTSYDEGQRKVDSDYSSSQNFNQNHRRVDSSFSSTNYRPTSTAYDEGQRKVDTDFSSTSYNNRQHKTNPDWNSYGTERTYTNIEKPSFNRTYTNFSQTNNPTTHHIVEGSVNYNPNSRQPPTSTTTTTNVFYAQPLGNDEDSSEYLNSYPKKPTTSRTTTILVTKPPQHYPTSFDSRFGVVESSSPTPQMTVSVPSVIILPPIPSDPYSKSNSSNNVKVFQVYPSVQNTSFQVYPDPHMSTSYSSVSHSRDTGSKPQPEVVYSRDEGVVESQQKVPLYNTPNRDQRTFQQNDFNREYYKQNPNAEGNSEETSSPLPMSDALKLLLRPYINKSGTVTDDDAEKANSHIMSLLAPKEKPPKEDSELITTGEQQDLNESSTPQHHGHSKGFHDSHPNIPNPYKTPTENHHHHGHTKAFHDRHPNLPDPFRDSREHQHNKEFHDRHPHLPNPFRTSTEFNSRREPTTIPPRVQEREPEDIDGINIRFTDVGVPQARRDFEVCEIDCGNGKCVKKHQVGYFFFVMLNYYMVGSGVLLL